MIVIFLGQPDFSDTELTCPTYPLPPSAALLIASYADDPVCPGSVVNYTCIAGGLNSFKVRKCWFNKFCYVVADLSNITQVTTYSINGKTDQML